MTNRGYFFNYEKRQIKVLNILKTIGKVLKSVSKSPPAENSHHEKKASQPAMQINWLVATQSEPKTRKGLRTG